jgi:hypothetical protein
MATLLELDWAGCILLLSTVVLKRVSLVDIESQIFLQLLDFALQSLAGLEVLLALRLKCRIGLHKVVVELDKLLHLGECVASNVSLVAHLVLVLTIPLRVLVAGS